MMFNVLVMKHDGYLHWYRLQDTTSTKSQLKRYTGHFLLICRSLDCRTKHNFKRFLFNKNVHIYHFQAIRACHWADKLVRWVLRSELELITSACRPPDERRNRRGLEYHTSYCCYNTVSTVSIWMTYYSAY